MINLSLRHEKQQMYDRLVHNCKMTYDSGSHFTIEEFAPYIGSCSFILSISRTKIWIRSFLRTQDYT